MWVLPEWRPPPPPPASVRDVGRATLPPSRIGRYILNNAQLYPVMATRLSILKNAPFNAILTPNYDQVMPCHGSAAGPLPYPRESSPHAPAAPHQVVCACGCPVPRWGPAVGAPVVPQRDEKRGQ